ncbi:MAG: RNA polymerase sigma factor [Bacteroidia bacterium]|nr:RNA polymerase sigma factor [Bacteroidia bacterium]
MPTYYLKCSNALEVLTLSKVVDQALIKSVKERNQAAFKKLYESCIRYVYSIVKRYVSKEDDHQDVIQEIFARIFLSIDSFDDKKGEFKFWLRRLTINQCIRHYHKQAASMDIDSLESAAGVQSTLDEKISNLSKDDILRFLSGMPEGYRQIFMMVVMDDYTHQEVSDMLNISPETSRSQLHRAKKWIRENRSINNLNLLVYGL